MHSFLPSGSERSPVSANAAPSLWLYKFPPWFFPSNPPPKEFLSKQLQISESEAKGTGETNTFQNITSGVVHGHARLTRVKVPTNSAFRDQVITMILNVKRDAGKASSFAPSLVPRDEWQPSPSFPQPTLPPSFRDRLITSRPLTSTASGESISNSNPRKSQPTITNLQDFQFNPPDQTQAKHSSSRDHFRPSKLLSIITLGQNSQFSIREGQRQNINSAFNTVSTSASQQKTSNVPKQNLRHTLAHIALNYPYDHTYLTTLSDANSHLPLVNKNLGKSPEEPENGQKNFVWDGFRPLLKSYEDVRNIREEINPVHFLEHVHRPPFSSQSDNMEVLGQDREKWFWAIP